MLWRAGIISLSNGFRSLDTLSTMTACLYNEPFIQRQLVGLSRSLTGSNFIRTSCILGEIVKIITIDVAVDPVW